MPTTADAAPLMADETTRAIEAVLIVAERPVEPTLLAQMLEIPVDDVESRCQELAAGYDIDGRGFILAKVAGGWRFQSHPDQAPYVERFVLEGQFSRLSAAALETLAIVAYKQPISRAQVAAIRGVSVEGVMRTLEVRGYIAEVSRDPGPGQAVLFGTSQLFLEKLALDSLADLPPLSEFVPGSDVVETLEQGLRPDAGGELSDEVPVPDPHDPGGADQPPSTVDEGDDAPSEGGEAAVTAVVAPPSRGRDETTSKLDDAADRLDALVDQVRDRIAATEAALNEDDAGDEQADGPDEPDDAVGAGSDDSPGTAPSD
jgi:segregation and condensation protein B